MAARDDVPAMEEFVARHDMGHMRHIADVDEQVWGHYGIPGQPAWVFIDGESGDAERVLGALPEADLQARLEALGG